MIIPCFLFDRTYKLITLYSPTELRPHLRIPIPPIIPIISVAQTATEVYQEQSKGIHELNFYTFQFPFEFERKYCYANRRFIMSVVNEIMYSYMELNQYQFEGNLPARTVNRNPIALMQDSENPKAQLEAIMAKGRKHLRVKVKQ